MNPYDHLRDGMQGTKSMDKLFTRLALNHDAATAAVVAMAAQNTPRERVADIIDRSPAQVDAIVTAFNAALRRWIDEEKRSAA